VVEKLLQLRIRLGTTVTGGDMPVKVALDFWMSSLKPSVEWYSCRRIEIVVEGHIKPFLGDHRLDKLTPYLIADWYTRMTGAGVTGSSQRRAGQVLRQALGQAVRFKLLQENVAKLIPLPKVRRRDINPLSPTQARFFLDLASTDRWFALYQLALDSGARQGELLALTWADLQPPYLSVTKNLTEVGVRKWGIKDTKTRAGRRRVCLTPQTVELLESGRKEGHRPMWEVRGGAFLTRQNLYQYSFRPLVARSGLDIKFHDLRHSCATLLLSSGVNLKVVSERLGHSNSRITLETYCHVLPGDQERAAKTLESILGGLGASRIDSGAEVGGRAYEGCPD
jgi:integrase